MDPEDEIICFDGQTIEQITSHCNSYAIMRNAMVIGITPVTSMRFAQFCNDQARILDMIMGKPGEPMVRELYGMAVHGIIPIGTAQEDTAFRELLGCLLGLYEAQRQRLAKAN